MSLQITKMKKYEKVFTSFLVGSTVVVVVGTKTKFI